ncbi:DUF4249 domain-containing protein [Dinghuibacter silviterrae]|uniref:Uncharacterized protein DUF4249 n=1 Tax=Dinghuibacter silviterrae TaxID=1539049 RepID=A0A4R8DTS2_9BACT|nr:DUF4249 domain-containing protein [Dinghuibacter silviterrae]TDX01714.1 uncharacterized protein DUF4249 [Dinghuibacter silviterrae]
MKSPRLLFLVVLAGLAACQKTVHLNLDTTSPQLVIDGQVTNLAGPYTVKLSTSVDYYANDTFPPVTGATVIIADVNANFADTLTETSPGLYKTHTIQGISGHTYGLAVTSSGNTYTAMSTMPAPVNLDSITFYNASFGGKNKDIQPIPNFQDPAGVANYYQFVVYDNGKEVQKTFVFSDRLSDGRYIHEPLQTDTSDIHPFDQCRIDMYCIDKNVYNYFYEVTQITESQAGNAAPGNPTTNITGGALGIFSAHTVSSKTANVPNL